jgi:hypothetical protein
MDLIELCMNYYRVTYYFKPFFLRQLAFERIVLRIFFKSVGRVAFVREVSEEEKNHDLFLKSFAV